MATVDELIQQYQTDEELQKEIADILADGKVTIPEFIAFTRKHNLDVSIDQLPSYIEKAKELGLMK